MLKHSWHSSIVRAAMGVEHPGGYLSYPEGNLARVEQVVEAAIANDMYVIVDWHSHQAEHYPQQATAFFTHIARKYAEHHNIIYEIYNEPLAVNWSSVIKPYAEQVIKAIRAIDKDNLIVVGTPQWSQLVDEAALNPIQASNIAYSLHFYAGSHGQRLRARAKKAMDNGAALFVTEWGTVQASGDGPVFKEETQAWMWFLRLNHISHVNWAVNDKAEGASTFKPNSAYSELNKDENLSESGRYVKQIMREWID